MNFKDGGLMGIAVRSLSRGPIQELDHANLTAEHGVMQDFRGKPGARQVTVLAAEDWEAACRDLDMQLPWTNRRANLLVKGIQLQNTTDAFLHLGNAVLQVTGETDPCPRMDEAQPGLLAALKPEWRGGVCCRVIQGGEIAVGMAVRIEPANQDHSGCDK